MRPTIHLNRISLDEIETRSSGKKTNIEIELNETVVPRKRGRPSNAVHYSKLNDTESRKKYPKEKYPSSSHSNSTPISEYGCGSTLRNGGTLFSLPEEYVISASRTTPSRKCKFPKESSTMANQQLFQQPALGKKFSCQTCGLQFYNQSILESHNCLIDNNAIPRRLPGEQELAQEQGGLLSLGSLVYVAVGVGASLLFYGYGHLFNLIPRS